MKRLVTYRTVPTLIVGMLLCLPSISSGAGINQSAAGAAEQKLRLLNYQLQPEFTRKIEQSNHAEARDMLQQGRKLARKALTELEAGNIKESMQTTKQALELVTGARNALRERDRNDSQAKQRNTQLLTEIESYRQAFQAGLIEKGPQAAGLLDRARVEELLQRADRLRKGGEEAKAQPLLESAYELTVDALTRLRRNETVVYGLDFRTPADEFQYEQRRFDSYQLLVRQMQTQKRRSPGAKKLVERYVAEAARQRQEAERQAAKGNYPMGIESMEKANKAFIRALQMMGLPVPG